MLSVCPLSSHPPVVFSFRPYEQLKEPPSLKSFKAEVSVMRRGEKKTGRGSKKTLCFGDWLCQEEFLLEDSKRLAEGGAEEVFGKVGERCELQLQRETSLLWFAGVPHCGSATGLSLALLHSGDKEGISSFIYSIGCHIDPQMAPFPLQTCNVSLFGWSPQSSPQKERRLMGHCS